VEALPWTAYSVRLNHQEFSIGLVGWGSNTAEAGYTLVNVIGSWDPASGRGAANSGRYSNPMLDAVTDTALATLDDGTRERRLIEAVGTAMAQLPIIPLHQLINYWAARQGILYEPREDERSLAMNAHAVR
jgi:peptide/nickel transport system substrate-binding protein